MARGCWAGAYPIPIKKSFIALKSRIDALPMFNDKVADFQLKSEFWLKIAHTWAYVTNEFMTDFLRKMTEISIIVRFLVTILC